MADDEQPKRPIRLFITERPSPQLSFMGFEGLYFEPGVDARKALRDEIDRLLAPRVENPCTFNTHIVTGECHDINSTKIIHADGTVEYRDPEQ